MHGETFRGKSPTLSETWTLVADIKSHISEVSRVWEMADAEAASDTEPSENAWNASLRCASHVWRITRWRETLFSRHVSFVVIIRQRSLSSNRPRPYSQIFISDGGFSRPFPSYLFLPFYLLFASRSGPSHPAKEFGGALLAPPAVGGRRNLQYCSR